MVLFGAKGLQSLIRVQTVSTDAHICSEAPCKVALGQGESSAKQAHNLRGWAVWLRRASIPTSVLVGTLIAFPAKADTEWLVAPSLIQFEPGQLEPGQLELRQRESVTGPPQVEQTRLDQIRGEQPQLDEQSRLARLRRLQAGIGDSQSAPATYLSVFSPPRQAVPTTSINASLLPTERNNFSNGIYLYGQQPVRDQLATAYFVFEATSNKIEGAFYMPSSSFDCVQGHIDNEQMVLSVADSYTQEVGHYALGLEASSTQLASLDGAIAPPLNISGYYPLPVNDADIELLTACQAQF